MSLEKGIGRVGTVAGVIFGLMGGWSFIGFSYRWMEDENRWLPNGRFTDGTLMVAALMFGVVAFIAIFFAVKAMTKIINWIINGFKE